MSMISKSEWKILSLLGVLLSPETLFAYVFVEKSVYIWDPIGREDLRSYLQEYVPDRTFELQFEFANSYAIVAHTDGIVNQSNGPVPTVSAFTSYWGPTIASDTQNLAQSLIGYGFRIIGPKEINVPLIVFGGGVLAFEGLGGFSSARLTARNSDDLRVIDQRFACGIGNPNCGAFTFTSGMTVRSFLDDGPELSGRVTMFASASSFPGVNGFGYALLDPIIRIDPLFLLSNPGFVIRVADGRIGNGVSVVPEPASWAMLIIGFGIVGFAARHRRSLQIA